MYGDNTAEKLSDNTEIAVNRGRKDKAKLQAENNIPIKDLKLPNMTERAEKVVAAIGRGTDPRDVWKTLKFVSYDAMAEYMRLRGYVWSIENNNYIYEPETAANANNGRKENDVGNQRKKKALVNKEKVNIETPMDERRKAALDFLVDNIPEIQKMIEQFKQPLEIPRYGLKGKKVKKSYRINETLAELLKELCENRKIEQQEFIEIVLLEGLKKYGYAEEIKAYMGV